jgi:hypothetical protein
MFLYLSHSGRGLERETGEKAKGRSLLSSLPFDGFVENIVGYISSQ